MPPLDAKDRRIAELESEVADLKGALAAALAEIEQLKAVVLRLSKTSRNSSSPPSKDPPGTGRPKKKRKNNTRRRGGQPGHKRHSRKLLEPDKVVPVVPDRCACCGDKLLGEDPSPSRHQQIEIPPIKPQVTDYLLHALKCLNCGNVTRGQLQADARGTFGARFCAVASLCSGKYRLSKRLVQELLSDLLGVELALGSVSNIERRMSAALLSPAEQAEEAIREQPIVHADETGWRENKAKAWMWVVACSAVAVFHIASSRSKQVIKGLLGESFPGYMVTDRWSAYNWLDVARRQLCWSHLMRDFQSWVDSGDSGTIYGEQLLEQSRRMFRWWHYVRDGTWTRERFVRRMRRVQVEVATLLTAAAACDDRRVAGMAKEMLKLEWALWSFVHSAGIEPTNNFAERTIRAAVIWRKLCFGTDSENGSRFVERMLTVVTTLKLQRRNPLEFLTETYRSALRGQPSPRLLPEANTSALAA